MFDIDLQDKDLEKTHENSNPSPSGLLTEHQIAMLVMARAQVIKK